MWQVGTLSQRMIDLLGLRYMAGMPIFMGQSNVDHMRSRHPEDYATYGAYIPEILARPDYVALHPKDGSLEYVKEFCVEGTYVKVAVRASGDGMLFARTLYVLNRNRVEDFIARGTLRDY